MLLPDAGGTNRLTIRVTGYQFPDASDPRNDVTGTWSAGRPTVRGKLEPDHAPHAIASDSEPTWREITAPESALLAEAVTGEWDGASELRSQLPGLLVRSGCSCGCGTIDPWPRQGMPAPMTPSPAPREGIVRDVAGEPVGGLLLFLRNGVLRSLEIYSYDGDPLPMPSLDRVDWEIVER